LSTVYLIRHGQAGTRDSYDSLSELGQTQARLLGEYCASQKLAFNTIIAGSLHRQQQTAQRFVEAYAGAHIAVPPIVTDPNWDEFDLTRVYREIAPQLCAEDQDFASDYAAMKQQIRASASSSSARIHREWHPCDSQVVQAWMSGRYHEEGETWQQFHDRIAGCVARIRQFPNDHLIAIFTSATPIGIWCGLAMDIFDQRSVRLAGVVQNSSYTVFRLRPETLRLFTFNATPHLLDPAFRTHR
jgi:broad specificity phosphatase PhoE